MSNDQLNNLRICIDRVIPHEYHPARAAMEEAALHAINRAAADASKADAPADGESGPELALPMLKKWSNGAVLRCRFLDGSPTQRQKVEAKAHIWEQYANIELQFGATGAAEIRISFAADSGSWSAVGTDALDSGYFPKYQPTMNFGWLKDGTADTEYERVVVHEFGHALGCIHEHQSPDVHLEWDTEAVYRYYEGPPNFWAPADIDSNILQRYSPAGMLYTRFDPDSIMLYMFPGELLADGKPTNMNTHLSEKDKQFIAQMYPRS